MLLALLKCQPKLRLPLHLLKSVRPFSKCKEEEVIEKDLLDPKCKVGLVTGGTSGIGFAVASQMLCAGAKKVLITGTDECKGQNAESMLNNTYGKGKAKFFKGNIACIVNLEDSFKICVKEWGRVDMFVNCAGMCDGAHWEKEIATNVIGTVRGTLMSYKYMGKEGQGSGGVVVNLAGINALEPLPFAPTLCASWYAILGATLSFGNEWHLKRSGVRVCCLCPGWTQTDYIKKLSQRGMTEEMSKNLESTVQNAKLQSPDVCAQAILHLIRKAESGTIWWIEGSKLFSTRFPPKEALSKLERQYV